MANRRFEMYEIRQIIARLRLGESDRGIARTQRTGRATVASIRRVAEEHGWLDPAGLLPEDRLLAAAFKSPRTTPQNVSSVEPFRESILAWHAQGIQVSTGRWRASTVMRAACTRYIAFSNGLGHRCRRRRSFWISRSARPPKSISAKVR
jgi:hypothetical protein